MKINSLSFSFFTGFIFLLGTLELCIGQSSATIENIRFSQLQRNLEIYYDIVDAAPDEQFRVWITLYKANGDQVKINDAVGDVGENQMGGKDKRVILTPGAELDFLSTHLYTEVNIRSNFAVNYNTYFNKDRINSLWQSALLPGLGASNKYDRPFWIMGVIGYAAIGGALFFDQEASSDYDSYLAAESIDLRRDLFDQSERNQQTSRLLAYGAGAIWVGNILWTLLDKYSKDNQVVSIRPVSGNINGLELSFGF